MSYYDELAAKIAEIGSRQSEVYVPDDTESVNDTKGHEIARLATSLLDSVYRMPGAKVIYSDDKRRWEFKGNLGLRVPGGRSVPSSVFRITGGR